MLASLNQVQKSRKADSVLIEKLKPTQSKLYSLATLFKHLIVLLQVYSRLRNKCDE
jgi:hypothetical protein